MKRDTKRETKPMTYATLADAQAVGPAGSQARRAAIRTYLNEQREAKRAENRKLNMGERYADAVEAARNPKPEIHVGVIPGIFGYGMTVMAPTQAEAETALRAKYEEWKADQAKHFPDLALNAEPTTFEGSFENFGGYYKRIETGKVYFDNFAE